MSKPNHTPGPWKHTGQGEIVGKEDNGYGIGYVDVCSVYLRAVRGRTNANIRLIAAAPDLLEKAQAAMAACERMTEQYGDVACGVDFLTLGNALRAAIAKATTGV